MQPFRRAMFAITSRRLSGSTRVADLEGDDAFLGAVGAVLHAGRTAGVHAFLEMPVAVPVTAFHDQYFFPEVVHESLRAGDAGVAFEEPGDEQALRVRGEDLLVDAFRTAFERLPGDVVGGKELEFGFRHGRAPYCFGIPAFSITRPHLAMSLRKRADSCSGVLARASMPTSPKRLRTSGMATTSWMAWFSARMISGEVPLAT